jgi:serine/threonine-protein kinase SRPK3
MKTSLGEEEENLDGEEKAVFLQFLRKMIQWVPEERNQQKISWEIHG